MAANSNSDPYASARLNMVEKQLRRRGIRDLGVLAAMERVPRHEFIPRDSWDVAYGDHPVSIGEGQTISQPYIVAAMVEWLRVEPQDRVLEVGTGTGYEAAVLGQLAAEVITVERQPRLAEQAEWNFRRLGYGNIRVIVGDGSSGFPELAPYNGIVIAAAAPTVPEALTEQLAEGGRLVIPVGSLETQILQLVQKKDGQLRVVSLEGARFVPLLGEKGFPERDF